ncbi:MAG: NAD-dependent epimerase/dehydratase family protein [candidate division KSB1 bacterium]
MIAFVTGGTGFIGSLLVEQLVQNDWEVHCLVRKSSSLKWLQKLPVQLVHGDLFAEETLAATLAQATHVFHLAGVTKGLTAAEYFRSNGEATRALLQACAHHGTQIERFVYVSSIAAAGPSRDRHLVREEETPHPVSIYGRSKVEGERACAEYAGKLPITIARPPIVYGPRDRDVYEYFKQVQLGVRLRPGRQKRVYSLIHVQDLVAGLITLAQHPRAAGETFFLTNPAPVEWPELGLAIARAMQKKTIQITVPVFVTTIIAALSELVAQLLRKPALLNFDKVREMRETHWIFSGEKARTQLGFVPALSLEEGLRQTVAWYRENEWL